MITDAWAQHSRAGTSPTRCSIAATLDAWRGVGLPPATRAAFLADNTVRHTGAQRRSRLMEIAAVVMIAAAVMGFLQQFDRPNW